MEDKKNTDCVYFLASPLTCKKGMQCEFRHSEVARLNPRDCWYWLSGNCLNPDCPFRHPPLDVSEEENPSSNSRVPCYFYSQGYCAKGDQCPFMHGFARRSQQVQTLAQQQQTPSQPQVPAASTVTQNGGSKLSIGQRSGPGEPPHQVQLETPEEHEQQHQVESSSSPTQDEEQQEKSDSGDGKSEELYRLHHHEWPMGGSSPDFDDVDPGAQQDFYSDDGDNYDTVLDPVNGSSSQLLDQIQSQQHRLLDSASYDFGGCRYERGAFQNGPSAGTRNSFNEYKPYDPPYQPSLPYDCMISSRQPLVQEQRIDPDLEALLMARNLEGLNRGRLEDRLVFPRGNHRSLFAANRLKLLSDNSSAHNRLVYDETNPALHHRLESWRVANGGSRSVHSRLGRPSVKTRLKYAANQRLHQHQFHNFQHHHQQQQQRHHARNSRYLGVMQQQHWRHNKVAKKPKLAAAAGAAPSSTSARNSVTLRESQFDGPKSLAELKAAKDAAGT
ncbi:zinc finger CCCH domain-containing protein 32-like [Selaginella moellendorffii]|uniref:zinc finger CCCH domain-containing protein 32-like n=1 Tax=Selaginella moellendorffii TaxID=88036 RepID=UPI000D1CD623|nr:zinc finger CCCH domain-containing protein 32-like [Selaginella moellendorffii]|eukprot:XP_024528429.1 zinc finger CCCH domain-containing protein 32-like [Selaginella moellendorffii]